MVKGSINYLLLLLLGKNLKQNPRTTYIYATGHHSQSTVHSALDVRTICQNSTEGWALVFSPIDHKTTFVSALWQPNKQECMNDT